MDKTWESGRGQSTRAYNLGKRREPIVATILQVPISKGGKTAYIEVNTASIDEGGDITDEVMKEAVLQGLKVILNRGTTKITSTTYPEEAERQAAAVAMAQKQFEAMKRNEIKFTGKRPKKEITGEVMTEAMRLARAFVKQKLKDDGVKLAHVKAKDITAVAKDIVADNPELVEQAKATVTARKEKAAGINVKVDLKGLIDSKLVAKEEEETQKRKASLSAAKAGKIAPQAFKSKPGQQVTAH